MDSAAQQFVRARADGLCEYCQIPQKFFAQNFQFEHIISKQHGGSSDVSNLAIACSRCNLSKGPNVAGVDPVTKELTRLFSPRTNDWFEHFTQATDGELLGISPVGRTTVYVLDMNAPRRVKLREAISILRKEQGLR